MTARSIPWGTLLWLPYGLACFLFGAWLTLERVPPQRLALLPRAEGGPVAFPPTSGEIDVFVTRIVDGDTVAFDYLVRGGTARLYGINTPEIHSRDAAEKAAGLKAAEFLESLVRENSIVRAKAHGPDKYGRALLTLYGANGKSVNDELVKAGHAKVYFGEGPKP